MEDSLGFPDPHSFLTVPSSPSARQLKPRGFWIKCLVSISVWWIASVILIVMISKTQGKGGIFPYSFALSALVQLTTGCIAWLCSKSIHKSQPKPLHLREWMTIAAIGLIQGIEIGLTNKVLQYLTIASRTIINSGSVLFMMLSAWMWSLESLGLWRALSCILLISGGVLQGCDQVAGHQAMHVIGVIMQLSSMLCSSQRWALFQVVLRSQPESGLGEMSKLQLLSRVMPITSLVCFILVLIFELDVFKVLPPVELLANVLLISTGVIAMVYAELLLVQELSAVAFNVLAAIHQIPIVLAGVLFQHNEVGNASIWGFASCLAGAVVYALARKLEKP